MLGKSYNYHFLYTTVGAHRQGGSQVNSVTTVGNNNYGNYIVHVRVHMDISTVYLYMYMYIYMSMYKYMLYLSLRYM